jgi:hypothetical protein
MDRNKLKKLRSISYKIMAVCGICEHGNFENGKEFGTCNKHDYVHLKHKQIRQLSIHIYGVCEEGYKSNKGFELTKFSEELY